MVNALSTLAVVCVAALQVSAAAIDFTTSTKAANVTHAIDPAYDAKTHTFHGIPIAEFEKWRRAQNFDDLKQKLIAMVNDETAELCHNTTEVLLPYPGFALGTVIVEDSHTLDRAQIAQLFLEYFMPTISSNYWTSNRSLINVKITHLCVKSSMLECLSNELLGPTNMNSTVWSRCI